MILFFFFHFTSCYNLAVNNVMRRYARSSTPKQARRQIGRVSCNDNGNNLTAYTQIQQSDLIQCFEKSKKSCFNLLSISVFD